MSVPNRLNNSTATVKYIIDAEELNANFDSITAGTAFDSTTVFSQVALGVTTSYPVAKEGLVFYVKDTETGAGGFYGYADDGSGNLIMVTLG